MSNLSDVINGADFYGGANYAFTFDRFCSENSAIYLNYGYLKIPIGSYFSASDFSLIIWIQLRSYEYNSKIIDFASNVAFGINLHTGNLLAKINLSSMLSNQVIQLNKWSHVALVLSGTTSFVYVNGVQVSVGSLNTPLAISTTDNYIGKSNTLSDSNANAVYDELKIYERALKPNDILIDYLMSSNNGLFHLIFSYISFENL